MTWSPDSSTTGGAQTGFTSPTFTLVDDTAPVVNAKQKTVSAIGGTQGTATANSASSPFTATFYKPAVLRALPTPNPVTGLYGQVPNNQYKLIIRKGGFAAAGVPVTAICRLTIDVPAGMDAYNPDNVRAMISFLIGVLSEESADVGDTVVTAVL
ncbi:TPA_asm: coat protein [ssRNA phage Gephyllon.4_5]|uniref:Coat protein n=2 Tax=Norzivirales TaxID=2842247 RepID=A0A8S5KYJ4_9VIRU|nr:coat protein [ssRNA phage Gephyllon.4_5]QDH87840.1 MAG: hypothetical protein H4BulkLitter22363_000002 [Leviviridae sp.]DAD50489.1 TPA_asm: coat protein [ssRNA phage Gephyllon.4_5]